MATVNTLKTYSATPSGGSGPFEYLWTVSGGSSYTNNNGVTLGVYQGFGSLQLTWTSCSSNNVDVCIREQNNPTCLQCTSFTVGVTGCGGGCTLSGVSISES